jgi:arylsulfatase A-like enzyme
MGSVHVQVGTVLAGLDDLGLSNSTVVIFHADHGYFMGESGEWEKKMLFENTARVPLLIHDPLHPVQVRGRAHNHEWHYPGIGRHHR